MRIALQLVTAPQAEPVSKDELRYQARAEASSDPREDAALDRYLITARQEVEEYTGLLLMPQVWDLWLDHFPAFHDRSVSVVSHGGAEPGTFAFGPSWIYGGWGYPYYHLYRRPILDYWAEHDETLGAIIRHVLVHEIGHHFGLSDDDMHTIEESIA